MLKKSPYGPNGHLTFKMGFRGAYRQLTVTGGPFDYFTQTLRREDNSFGVCVRSERASDYDLHLPIRDFSTPEGSGLAKGHVDSALKDTLRAMLGGKDTYVGCMGGFGRTGLFLALLVKVLEPDVDPVSYTRACYYSGAVETTEQKKYVDSFDVTELRLWFFWAAWRTVFGLKP